MGQEARKDSYDVVWQPSAGPQSALLSCPVFEVFFGGARGGGKSDAILGDWASHADLYGEHALGLVIRRNRVQLVPLINRSKAIFRPLGARWHESRKEWRWPNGALLRFAYLDNDKDAEEYQGHSYTRVYIEELTNFPSPDPVLKLMATLRSGAKVPCGFRGTGNPGGPGHTWVKARYITSGAPWQVQKTEFKDPWSGDTITRDRVFIPSKLKDNPYLGADYVATLQLTGSPEIVRAWLEGDWSVVEGAFFPEFSERIHVIPPFVVPAHWGRFRAMDWGSAKPSSIGWYAVVGEEYYLREAPQAPAWAAAIMPGLAQAGKPESVTLPRGALVRYREMYTMAEHQINVGLKLDAEELANRIVKEELNEPRGIDGRIGVSYGVIDPSANKVDGGPSIMERMNKVIIRAASAPFRPADNARATLKGPISGWDHIRHRLTGDGVRPMIYFFSNNKDLIRTLPGLPHDETNPEDADTEYEDHACDELRYACMSRPYIRQEARKEAPKLLQQATLQEVFEMNERKQSRAQPRI